MEDTRTSSARRRRLVALGSLIGSLTIGLTGGGAWAYFSAGSGSGSGTTSVGTVSSVTIDAATGTVSSLLQPGSSADLTLTIDNPNSFAVTLTGIAQNGTLTVSGGSGCTAGNSGVSVPTNNALSVTIGSGNGQVVHITNGAAMSASSNTGCQSASFQIPVTITVHKG